MSHWRGLWRRLRRRGVDSEDRNDDPQYRRDLAEFLAADELPPQGDASFRERLREELWRTYFESRPSEKGPPTRRVDK
jgi:hypothetical protein